MSYKAADGVADLELVPAESLRIFFGHSLTVQPELEYEYRTYYCSIST